MEDLKLSEAQSRYFGDLFLCCCDKNEASGKVSFDQATELFRSSNLSADVVRQVPNQSSSSSSSPASPSAYLYSTLFSLLQILRIAQISDGMSQISRRQFYSCLKLISACQAGFAPTALTQDTLHEDISPMALPRFSWFGANDVHRDGAPTTTTTTSLNNGSVVANGQSSFNDLGKSQDLIQLSQESRRASGPSNIELSGVGQSEQPSTDSEVEQNDDSSAIENSDVRLSPSK